MRPVGVLCMLWQACAAEACGGILEEACGGMLQGAGELKWRYLKPAASSTSTRRGTVIDGWIGGAVRCVCVCVREQVDTKTGR